MFQPELNDCRMTQPIYFGRDRHHQYWQDTVELDRVNINMSGEAKAREWQNESTIDPPCH
jgi:hypothetical protein